MENVETICMWDENELAQMVVTNILRRGDGYAICKLCHNEAQRPFYHRELMIKPKHPKI